MVQNDYGRVSADFENWRKQQEAAQQAALEQQRIAEEQQRAAQAAAEQQRQQAEAMRQMQAAQQEQAQRERAIQQAQQIPTLAQPTPNYAEQAKAIGLPWSPDDADYVQQINDYNARVNGLKQTAAERQATTDALRAQIAQNPELLAQGKQNVANDKQLNNLADQLNAFYAKQNKVSQDEAQKAYTTAVLRTQIAQNPELFANAVAQFAPKARKSGGRAKSKETTVRNSADPYTPPYVTEETYDSIGALKRTDYEQLKKKIDKSELPKQPKSLTKEEKAVANDIEKRIVGADKVSKWINPDNKLSKEEIQEAKTVVDNYNKSGSRQGVRNGVVWGDTPEAKEKAENIQALSNKINPVAAFASGMLGRIPSLISGAAQGLLSAGSSDWVSDEQKEKGVKAISEARERANQNRESMAKQNPVANVAGNLIGTALQYNAVNSALEGTAAANALSNALGERGANLALGEMADVALDTIPTEVENYQKGMRGADLAKDTAQNLAINAAFNTGAEFIPSLIKNGYNALVNKNTAQAAEEAVENTAKSAPISEPIPSIKPEPINPEPIKTEIDTLANQQKQAAKTIENLSEQVPDVPKSEWREFVDNMIDTRNSGALVAPGSDKTDIGKKFLSQLDAHEQHEKDLYKLADEMSNDPEVQRLKEEVRKYSMDTHKTLRDVRNPVNPDVIIKHQEAMDNLENYLKNTSMGDSIRRDINGLEMPDEARTEIENLIPNRDEILSRIGKAQSADEVKSIIDEVKGMTDNADSILRKNAATRTVGKYDFDDATRSFAEAIDGRQINITPEMKAELNITNVSDLNNQLYFSSNGKRFKPKFTTKPGKGTPIDVVFHEIDDSTGGAISNFMRSNGMDPEVPENLAKGMRDYASYLKSNKDANKLQEYTGGMFDEFMDSVQKAGNDKIASFQNSDTKIPLNLQFFADQARELEKTIESMEDGEAKTGLRRALSDFWNKIRGAKTQEEAEEAWNALSKTRTNTMAKSGDFTEYELENVIPESMARYVKQEETIPYDNALDKIKKDYSKELKKFTKDFKDEKEVRANLGNAEDINGMYIMVQDLTKKARATEDMAARNRYYAQARQVSRNLIRAERESGRAIQALAKFSRTPERILTRAQGVAEDFVDKALSKEPNLKKGIEEVSNQIDNFLKDVDVDALTREEVEDMVNQAILRNNRLRKRLGKGDIQKLTNAIMEERQYADIQKHLEFLTTGYRDIDGETMQTVQDMFNEARDLPFESKKRVEIENEAYKLLATQIAPNGGRFRDKLDAWRYLSMLANPTTHLKNMLGNVAFGKGMVSVKNGMAAMIESAADKVSKVTGKGGIERTKSLLTKNDSALVKAAEEDGLENAFRELSGSHYFDAGKSIDNAIPAFNTKTPLGRFLNRAAEINEGLLSKEDEMAMMAKYKTSLAGYLKANGADASIFKATDEQSKQLLENGRTYAINQAKMAAFHQDAPVMQKLSNLTNDLKYGTKGEQAAGLAIDTILPFKKTPANILKSAVAYSPFELAKVGTDIVALRKGTIKAADLIDDIAKTATGSAAFGIGALLAHEGILKIGSDLSDEEASFDKQTGRQNVSIKLRIPGVEGDVYVPIQELMPSAAPVIFGGTVYETLKNKKGEDSAINTLGAGMGAIAEGMIDMSMLSGIADTLMSVRGAESGKDVVESLAVNAAGNLASQMLPTIGRKANVTLDDTKRSTYSDKTGTSKKIEQETKYLQTKIPGLQQAGEAMKKSNIPALKKAGDKLTLEPNVDVKGQVQDSPGVAGFNNIGARAINNFLSPVGNITKDTSTKYDEERRRLEKATGETKVLPYIAPTEAKVGEKQLTPKEWTEYRKTRGQMRESLAKGIIDSKNYKNLPDADKAELLKQADSFSKAYSQGKYGKEMSSDNQKLADIYNKEGVDGFINYVTYKKDLETQGNTRQETKLSVVRKMSPEAQKEMLPKIMTKEEQKRWKAANGNLNQYWKMYDAAQKTAQEKAIKKRDQEYRQSVATQKAFDRLGISKEQGVKIQEELASYGAIDEPETVKYYAHAKQTIPSLTPKEYVGYLDKLSRGDNKISQADVIKYANEHNLSQSEMNTYWNAFTDTKKVPRLSRKGNWYYK